MGQTLCCQADDIDHLIDRNSSFSSSLVSNGGQPVFLEDGFGQHKPLLNSPSTYTTFGSASSLSASSISTVDGNRKGGFSSYIDSPVKGQRKLNYSMSAKPLYFFPQHSIHSFCFDNFVREYCLGWTGAELEKSVCLPDRIDEEDWIVVNLIAFYNDLCVFVSRIECNEQTCNAMTAGKGRSFSYDFADKNISPKQISALSYIHRVLDYVTQHFDVPSNTYESRHKVVSLLLRSFGHILHHHFPDFIKDGYEHLLVNCLKRLCYFVDHFSLFEEDDFEPFRTWFKQQRERDRKLNMLKYELL